MLGRLEVHSNDGDWTIQWESAAVGLTNDSQCHNATIPDRLCSGFSRTAAEQ